jgi:ubiquinone/menaquinone biosynthesis C-methylase UbiE
MGYHNPISTIPETGNHTSNQQVSYEMTSACQCYFEAQHEQHSHPAMRMLERDVLGCDFGGTSWTTKAQADAIPAALGLGPGVSLLEIGAGTGWPGLYMAGQTGCDLTLLDIPVNSLKYANQRAIEEKVESRCQSVAASGSALPFTDNSFNAIGHSDVLCCLPDKLEMLEECRRAASDGARMLFYVIAPSAGLSESDLERACQVGPPFVGVPADYGELLESSNWEIAERIDLTKDYLHALRRLADGLEVGSEVLEEVLGPQEFTEQLRHRREQITAIEQGLLEREVFLVNTK